jgi:hypothetical protein
LFSQRGLFKVFFNLDFVTNGRGQTRRPNVSCGDMKTRAPPVASSSSASSTTTTFSVPIIARIFLLFFQLQQFFSEK